MDKMIRKMEKFKKALWSILDTVATILIIWAAICGVIIAIGSTIIFITQSI